MEVSGKRCVEHGDSFGSNDLTGSLERRESKEPGPPLYVFTGAVVTERITGNEPPFIFMTHSVSFLVKSIITISSAVKIRGTTIRRRNNAARRLARLYLMGR